MKVALITTVHHNVGDDFVRDGILYLMTRILGRVEPRLIHKHFPASVRSEWAWLHDGGLTRVMDRIPRLGALRVSGLIERLPLRPSRDQILGADVLVQCGAPVYWLHGTADCSANEWFGPLIQRRWDQQAVRIPFLNLGAGACQAYDSDGREFAGAPATLAYIRGLHARCALTTVRDELSNAILRHAGLNAPLLPCPSLFARDHHGLAPSRPEFLALNYMPMGGHYRFDQRIDQDAWDLAFVAFARAAARREPCLMVCHNRDEYRAAARLLPDLPRFHSSNYRDYLAIYARARGGVVNRVHGAFALASFGRPALVVGNDSRARMAAQIGMPSLHVAEATPERLQSAWGTLEQDARGCQDRLESLREAVRARYLELLSTVLPV